MEFAHLSGGINATVDALKESIEEAETRIDRELTTAKAIQENALPSTFPPFPEIDRFDIYASMNPAREVGGDFYDFFLIDDHTLGFLVADVSGKGIPAALFMMAAKTEVGNYMASGMDLAQAVQSANYHLCQGNDAGMFVTVWAATLDYETGELTYVNAGHNPPLLRHDGQWSWLRKRSGLFVGTFETAKYRTYTLQLTPATSSCSTRTALRRPSPPPRRSTARSASSASSPRTRTCTRTRWWMAARGRCPRGRTGPSSPTTSRSSRWSMACARRSREHHGAGDAREPRRP